LDDLQWADWSREGELLVATRIGLLQIRELEGESPEILFEVDLSNLEPTPNAGTDLGTALVGEDPDGEKSRMTSTIPVLPPLIL
jgi:hypothetical protein